MQNKLDYKKNFTQISSLPLTVLLTTGRTGSDFFHSLLDQHTEIVQLEGQANFVLFWENAYCKDSFSDLLDEFLWYHDEGSINISLFKSRYNKFERLDRLGPDMNECFEHDITLFKTHFENLVQDLELTFVNFFMAFHAAYALMLNQDPDQSKLLFYHLHHMSELEKFSELFEGAKNFSVICSVREPKNTFTSSVVRWKEYLPSSFTPQFVLQQWKRVILETEPAREIVPETYSLVLERLHSRPEEVLKNFCEKYKLTFQNTMLQSTFNGKLWWGDELLKTPKNGFGKGVFNEVWTKNLFHHEMLKMDFFCQERTNVYGLKVSNNLPYLVNVLTGPLLIFLPTKFGAQLLNVALKEKNLKKILMLVVFYFRRVRMDFWFYRKRISDPLKAPRFF